MLRSKKEIEKYITENINNDNSEMYAYCQATTQADKDYLRTRKSRIRKKLLENDTTLDIKQITPAAVEKLILDKLNKKSNMSDALIRMSLDYLTKLKIKDIEGMERLDMEKFIIDHNSDDIDDS